MFAFEFSGDTFNRAPDTEWLIAANTMEWLLLLEDARGSRWGAEIELRRQGYHFFGACRLAKPALDAGTLDEPQQGLFRIVP